VSGCGCDSDVVDDIAEQLIYGEVGKNLKVIFGGGSRHFVNSSHIEHGLPGRRKDGKHLINEWLNLRPEIKREFIRNRDELMNVSVKEVGQIFGLFNNDHIRYKMDIDRDNENHIYPTLSEMTTKAIDILSENEKGYFLFVEGGRIDHGHHRLEIIFRYFFKIILF
jgi:alkaline phosphatase